MEIITKTLSKTTFLENIFKKKSHRLISVIDQEQTILY
jgi:hypothetical protein